MFPLLRVTQYNSANQTRKIDIVETISNYTKSATLAPGLASPKDICFVI